jgi:hypothetical protein
MRPALAALLLLGCNQVFGIEDTLPPAASDFDHDGIDDTRDDCPTAANADQVDTDHDGFGNACDPCPMGAQSGSDADMDGVDDACDACLTGSNGDEDGDSALDGCDVCPGLAGAQIDSDGDGLGDACDPDTVDTSGSGPITQHRTFFDSFDPPADGWEFGFEHWVTAGGSMSLAAPPLSAFHGPWNPAAVVDGTGWVASTLLDTPAAPADNDVIGLFTYRADGSYTNQCALRYSTGAWKLEGTATVVPVGPQLLVTMYARPAAGGIYVYCVFDGSTPYIRATPTPAAFYPAITGSPGARFHWFDVAQ